MQPTNRTGVGRAWSVLLGAGLGVVVGAACTLEIDHTTSCGDGYVDREAGEECDTAVPSSYINACVGTMRPDGEADCDPYDCTIINTLEQCAVCGDGRVDEELGEQCDGDNLNGQSCPGGVGTLQCSTSCRFDVSACRRCGNGVLDVGEECDPNLGLDELTMGKPDCTELPSPYGDALPYSAGVPGSCRDDCRWERTTCSYCGNGEIENGDYDIDFDGTMATPEWCDGNDFDRRTLEDELADSVCTVANADLRPIVECASNCLDFIPLDLPQPCCVKTGAACPSDDSPVRCCYAEENPNSTVDPCQVVFDTELNVFDVCR